MSDPLAQYPTHGVDLSGFRGDVANDRAETLRPGPSMFDSVVWVDDLPTWEVAK